MDTPPEQHTDHRTDNSADADPARLLAILVSTEDGRVRAGVTEPELATLLAQLGPAGNRYAVVERAKIEDNVFIQAWRGDDGVYSVEHRDGGPRQHFTLRVAGPAEVTELFVAWARGDESWRAADWQPVGPAPQAG